MERYEELPGGLIFLLRHSRFSRLLRVEDDGMMCVGGRREAVGGEALGSGRREEATSRLEGAEGSRLNGAREAGHPPNRLPHLR